MGKAVPRISLTTRAAASCRISWTATVSPAAASCLGQHFANAIAGAGHHRKLALVFAEFRHTLKSSSIMVCAVLWRTILGSRPPRWKPALSGRQPGSDERAAINADDLGCDIPRLRSGQPTHAIGDIRCDGQRASPASAQPDWRGAQPSFDLQITQCQR